MSLAELFLEYALPYRANHLIKDSCGWINTKKPLSDEKLNNAIYGKEIIAYFASSYTKLIAIDIDDHVSKTAWTDGMPSQIIYSKYQEVLNRIKLWPSLVVKTPRGIHLYWFFNEKSPTNTIVKATKEIIHGLDVEVRPTMKEGIRVPNANEALDPQTLTSIRLFTEKIKVYRLSEILPFYLPQSKNDIERSRVVGLTVYKAEKKVMETLGNGSTNSELCYMAGIYKSNGYSEGAAISAFQSLLTTVGYTGPLSHRELSRRISCLYRGDTYNHTKYEYDISAHKDLISKLEAILSKKYSKRAMVGVLALIRGILEYKTKQDMIYSDPGMRAEYNYINTFFIADMKYGFVPIPRDVFRSFNFRYKSILNVLKTIGFIVESDKNYKVGSYCKSYYIETDPNYLNDLFDSIGYADKKQYYTDIIQKRSQK